MSECSLSFASVIVHRNVCMHTLHWMFIAFWLLASWEPAEGGSGGQRVNRVSRSSGMADAGNVRTERRRWERAPIRTSARAGRGASRRHRRRKSS